MVITERLFKPEFKATRVTRSLISPDMLIKETVYLCPKCREVFNFPQLLEVTCLNCGCKVYDSGDGYLNVTANIETGGSPVSPSTEKS